MSKRWTSTAWTGLAAALLLGCVTSPVSRGAEFYRQGRHIDADLVFEHGEPELARWDRGERARYALYRGVNYLALGDQLSARRWLLYGAELGATSAAVFSTSERELLQSSLSSIEPRAADLPKVVNLPAAASAAAAAALTAAGVRPGLAAPAAPLRR